MFDVVGLASGNVNPVGLEGLSAIEVANVFWSHGSVEVSRGWFYSRAIALRSAAGYLE